MAVAVVHPLEAVQVDEQQSDVAAVPPRARDRIGQAAVQRAVVEEASETVPARIPGVRRTGDFAESGGGPCDQLIRRGLTGVAAAPGHGTGLLRPC